MASLSSDKAGNRMIQFPRPGAPHGTLRLGKISLAKARKVKGHVEDLVSAKRMQQAVESRTANWVADLDDDLHGRLATVGLVAPRNAKPMATLGPFLDAYVTGRHDVKPATKIIWGHTVRNLKTHFGVERELTAVNEGDADGFKQYLVGLALAPSTVSKRLEISRMFFRSALRHKLIAENPFAEVSAKATMSTDRQRYVTREETDRVLAVCNPTWRVIVALCRYGGLRCPSEALSLRWQDINWDTGRIVVTSPKTAHHEGKGSRVIPLFPELRAILSEAYAIAGDGADYLVPEYRASAVTARGWSSSNLRTQIERIIKRAGLVPWPRPFHALRGSRETELVKEYPLHVVTSWLGNTQGIALKHYLMTTDADFERAAKCAAAGNCKGSQGRETLGAGATENSGIAGQCDLVHHSAHMLTGRLVTI
jgi:integrase